MIGIEQQRLSDSSAGCSESVRAAEARGGRELRFQAAALARALDQDLGGGAIPQAERLVAV
jgi:hypothetical protein